MDNGINDYGDQFNREECVTNTFSQNKEKLRLHLLQNQNSAGIEVGKKEEVTL